jgi:hypothetical protein
MADAAPGQPPASVGRPSRRALVVLSVALALLLCACMLLLRGQLSQSTPDAAARGFYTALSQHEFQTAYELLTADMQAEWARRGSGTAEQNFAQFAGSLDRVYGDVRSFEVGPVRISGTRASTLVTVRRGASGAEVDLLMLARSGSGWGVETFSPGVPTVTRWWIGITARAVERRSARRMA